MAIEVDWKRIRATHRELGGDGALILELTGEGWDGAATLDEAILDEPFPEGEGPTNGGWILTPSAAYLLIEADGYKGVEEWIEQLAHRLSIAGVTGSLSGARGSGRVSWAVGIEMHPSRLTASLCYRPLPPDRRPSLSWGADPDLLGPATQAPLAWTLDHADPAKVFAHVSLRADPAAIPHLVNYFAKSHNVLGITGYSKPLQRVRDMTIDARATVRLGQFYLETDNWQSHIDSLRPVILAAPLEHLNLAYISPQDIGHRNAGGQKQFVHDDFTLYRCPELYSEWIDDVSGIQILTSAHLAKAHDLSDWTVQPLDNDHWLVESNDLAAWYAKPQGPWDYYPTAMITKARADFGEMILTPTRAISAGFRTTDQR